MDIYENLWKSMEIHENQFYSMLKHWQVSNASAQKTAPSTQFSNSLENIEGALLILAFPDPRKCWDWGYTFWGPTLGAHEPPHQLQA